MTKKYRVFMMLHQYKHSELLAWLKKENIPVIIDLGNGPGVDYVFKDEENAMAFKLRWV